jgi:hypothetical protein
MTEPKQERRSGADRRRSVAQLLMFPLYCVNLDGADGRPSFAKLITCTVVASYFVGHPIPVGAAIVVIASSYGYKMFKEMLDSKTVTSHEEIKGDLTEIWKRRDSDAGVEPTR